VCVAGTRKWSPVSGLVGRKHSRQNQKEKAAGSLSAVQVVLPRALSLYGLPQTCHGGRSLFACCLVSVSTCLPATACLVVLNLEVRVILVRKSDLVGLLELLRILGHHSLVDGNLGGRKCG